MTIQSSFVNPRRITMRSPAASPRTTWRCWSLFKLEGRHAIAGAAVFSGQRDALGNPTFATTQTLAIASVVATF